ncbi:hypothetical protein [Parabacteroides pacaensis]|uniref:hypothetical protein n=1 Tax=Parabacteroides pacaensis TaxID=2086575 RepID=UPI001F4174F3|nr:hypothetical protein [Parabacteroides pacaensis]
MRIKAEEGFNPQMDVDIASLRFEASAEVNYGKGCTVMRTENDDADLMVIFNGRGNGITEDEFAPKLIGKYKNGNMLYGYARLPYLDYNEPLISARAPVFKEGYCSIEIENFGQVTSDKVNLKVESVNDAGKKQLITLGKVPGLQPYEKTLLMLPTKMKPDTMKGKNLLITIYGDKKIFSTFQIYRVHICDEKKIKVSDNKIAIYQ